MKILTDILRLSMQTGEVREKTPVTRLTETKIPHPTERTVESTRIQATTMMKMKTHQVRRVISESMMQTMMVISQPRTPDPLFQLHKEVNLRKMAPLTIRIRSNR
jgi:hypothetical protein